MSDRSIYYEIRCKAWFISQHEVVVEEGVIKRGLLANMKWLLKNGCPIGDSKIFIAAASYGTLDIMKWLLANGCPINDSGSRQNIKWLLEDGCAIAGRFQLRRLLA